MKRTTAAWLAACVLAAGCAKGPPEITSLSGRVTIDGKPVTAGLVIVASGDDIVRTSGTINADGTYSIVGAPVGAVRLAVTTEESRVILPEPGGNGRTRANPLYVATPKKYEKIDTSGLATTLPRGKATYDIELTAK